MNDMICIPEEIFLDGANRMHMTNIRSDTLQFDTDVAALFDDRVFVICELWRCGIRIKLDVAGYHLQTLAR